jgi:hypothetical protein
MNNKALTVIGVVFIITAKLIIQSAPAFKSNGENVTCVHPTSRICKLHNNDMTTKQNDCYRMQSYFAQQNFRNVPFGSPFPFTNVPFGLPFGSPSPNDYCTHPYFGQHKFSNDPFELPFP